MAKWLRNNILLAAVTAVCACCLGLLLKTEAPEIRFLVADQAGSREILPYEGAGGVTYVFLPAYAELEAVSIRIPSGRTVTLDGQILSDGMRLGSYQTDTDYEFTAGDRAGGRLRFVRSANVAAMYLDTATGTARHIHADKEYSETVSMVLIRPDGTEECRDVMGSLHGRGNTTWNYAKKPYALKLSREAELLGLGSAADWVLLANAADGSHMNNRVILDLARQTSMAWTPGCEYVDVYLNGEYSGLYLLTGKVDVGTVEADSAIDSFLCEFRIPETEEDRSYCVTTDLGRQAVIVVPRKIDSGEKAAIEELVRALERELLSGRDLRTSDLIDLDSWARKYILDEISANVDSDRASCYFFYADGKFYAGPIWDYDKGFGDCMQSRNPRSFVADNEKRSAVYSLPYYPILCRNPSFRQRVQELYQEEFLPLLQELVDTGYGALEERLRASIAMDQLRWAGLTPDLQSPALIAVDPASVRDYVAQKTEFLTSAWIDGVDYCTVQFELWQGAEYVNYAVERGECFDPGLLGMEDAVWVDQSTGAVFDFSRPITENMVFHLQRESAGQTGPGFGIGLREVLTAATIGLTGLLGAGLLLTDIRRRKGERSAAHDG